MIERKFTNQKIRELQVKSYITSQLTRMGCSKIEIKRTPVGERIIVYTSRPGLIVGRKGENINRLTNILRTKFKMENPQIEVGEIDNPNLDPYSVADKITYTLEKFGPKRFKFIGYDSLSNIMKSGAIGAEIIIGGAGVPGARAKSWRFSAGYLKKSGDVADSKVLKAQAVANLRRATVGVKVSIMPPDIKLPDKIIIKKPEIKIEKIEEKQEIIEDVKKEAKEKTKPRKKQEKKTEEKNGNNKKKRTKTDEQKSD
ncbi:30S ribosomal protein S3 [Candidatus Woesearchaeota archaeon]|nr:30S ribosomal protein S3 [Candidatus Woesearchaeota archaeon]